jgi:hypothetical protein
MPARAPAQYGFFEGDDFIGERDDPPFPAEGRMKQSPWPHMRSYAGTLFIGRAEHFPGVFRGDCRMRPAVQNVAYSGNVPFVQKKIVQKRGSDDAPFIDSRTVSDHRKCAFRYINAVRVDTDRAVRKHFFSFLKQFMPQYIFCVFVK